MSKRADYTWGYTCKHIYKYTLYIYSYNAIKKKEAKNSKENKKKNL